MKAYHLIQDLVDTEWMYNLYVSCQTGIQKTMTENHREPDIRQ